MNVKISNASSSFPSTTSFSAPISKTFILPTQPPVHNPLSTNQSNFSPHTHPKDVHRPQRSRPALQRHPHRRHPRAAHSTHSKAALPGALLQRAVCHTHLRIVRRRGKSRAHCAGGPAAGDGYLVSASVFLVVGFWRCGLSFGWMHEKRTDGLTCG